MAHKISVILAAFVVGFLIGVVVVNLTHNTTHNHSGFTSTYNGIISPYDQPIPLSAQDYNSLNVYTHRISCTKCFKHGIMSAQADALYAIQQSSSTPSQRVLPDAIAVWNSHYDEGSPAKLLPVHVAFIGAAARTYSTLLRGASQCATNCPVTKEDMVLWGHTPAPTIAQLWCAIALWRGVATGTQKLVYAAAEAEKPTSEQVKLLSFSSQDIAMADANVSAAPSRAQIALLAAAAAVKAGNATAAQSSYFLAASPYVVAQFDAALTSVKADKATPAEKALVGTMPPA